MGIHQTKPHRTQTPSHARVYGLHPRFTLYPLSKHRLHLHIGSLALVAPEQLFPTDRNRALDCVTSPSHQIPPFAAIANHEQIPRSTPTSRRAPALALILLASKPPFGSIDAIQDAIVSGPRSLTIRRPQDASDRSFKCHQFKGHVDHV